VALASALALALKALGLAWPCSLLCGLVNIPGIYLAVLFYQPGKKWVKKERIGMPELSQVKLHRIKKHD